MQFMPRWDQYVHNAHRIGFRLAKLPNMRRGTGRKKSHWELRNILEIFTSLTTKYINPWSNVNIKSDLFTLLVRHAAGYLSFERRRHYGLNKVAQNSSGDLNWIMCWKSRLNWVFFCDYCLFLFCGKCHPSLGSINTSVNDIIGRQWAWPGLGYGAFIRKHESCHWGA